jgi:uncharacterized protein
MMDDEFFERLRGKVLPYFEDGSGHDFNHTDRVYNMVIKISEGEGVDMDVVRAAALLHDIVRNKQRGGNVCHAEEGAKMARVILGEEYFPVDKIDDVVYCIEVHRYSKGLEARTKEAKILQDADRLDSLGAVGVARVFERGGSRGRLSYGSNDSITSLGHIKKKVLGILPETFKVRKAQEIAKGRYEFVRQFVERVEKEVRGEL